MGVPKLKTKKEKKMVRAKFRVKEITSHLGCRRDPETEQYGEAEQKSVKLCVVTGGSDENKKFWDATPSGEIWLTMVNPEAVEQFVLGSEMYVDFYPAK